ncbi:hypothetical protein PGB90_000344 [Kerria lacca]
MVWFVIWIRRFNSSCNALSFVSNFWMAFTSVASAVPNIHFCRVPISSVNPLFFHFFDSLMSTVDNKFSCWVFSVFNSISFTGLLVVIFPFLVYCVKSL